MHWNNVIEWALQYASCNEGSKGMSGAFDLPMQVTRNTEIYIQAFD